jgi:hypothetical protein
MTRFLKVAIPSAVAALAIPFCAGAAMAQQIERGTFHDEFTDTVNDFCDVPGLTVQLDNVIDGSFHVVTRGKSKVPYYSEHAVFTQLTTGPGGSVTSKDATIGKDFKITDNGDGTTTIQVLATGNSTLYDSSGKVIARNPGQVRYSILIDDMGTSDPSDDTETFLGFDKDSTGRSDDYCAVAVPLIS